MGIEYAEPHTISYSVIYFLFTLTEVNICVIRSLNILTEFDIHDRISRFMMPSWLSTEPSIKRIIP